ncbi:MAG TPA: GNAT family N-acetyltransferase, partial [Anaerolineae bacterium]
MNIQIRTLTEADLETADQIMQDAFRRTQSARAELATYLNLQPDGRLLALVNGEPVGMVGAIDYGAFAYIGTMGVRQAWQHRGIGCALMERLLEWLDARGCPMARLDASAAGQHLYPKLGFATDEQTHVFKLQQPIESTRIPECVRVARAQDLEAITEFDAPIFGARRAAVLERYHAWLNDRVFVAHDETGHVAGYLFAQTRSIGPWAAREPREAEALLAAALALSYEIPPVARVPSSNPVVADLL